MFSFGCSEAMSISQAQEKFHALSFHLFFYLKILTLSVILQFE